MTKSRVDKGLGATAITLHCWQLETILALSNIKVMICTRPDPAILFLLYAQWNSSICAPGSMFRNVHSSSVCNSSKLETNQMPTNNKTNCSIFFQRNTVKINSYMHQHICLSETCSAKRASHIITIWLHLCNKHIKLKHIKHTLVKL